MPAGQREPLSTRETAVRRWRGSFVNLFPVVSDSTEVPLSHLRCQLSTRHALRVPFQGSLIKASPERGGEPPQAVEGFSLCKIFSFSRAANPPQSSPFPLAIPQKTCYNEGNTAQRASDDFARHLLANFPSYFTKMLVNTSSIHSAFCFI